MKALKQLKVVGHNYRKTLLRRDEEVLDKLLTQLVNVPFAYYCGGVVSCYPPEEVPYLTAGMGPNDPIQRRWCGLRAWACGDYPFGG